MVPPALELAKDAAAFLRRQMARANLEGSQAPIVVNPRTQGWVFGFVKEAARRLEYSVGDGYAFQANVFVRVYDGTPSGEQLGLECFSMAQTIDTFFGAADMKAQFHAFEAQGARAAEHFVALTLALDELRATLLL